MTAREAGGGSKNDLLVAPIATWAPLPSPSSFAMAYFAKSFLSNRSPAQPLNSCVHSSPAYLACCSDCVHMESWSTNFLQIQVIVTQIRVYCQFPFSSLRPEVLLLSYSYLNFNSGASLGSASELTQVIKSQKYNTQSATLKPFLHLTSVMVFPLLLQCYSLGNPQACCLSVHCSASCQTSPVQGILSTYSVPRYCAQQVL